MRAAEYNSVLDTGDTMPSWDALPSVQGEPHSSDLLSEAKAVVVVFTCNSCPYAVDVEQRLIAMQKQLSGLGGELVAINVNTIDEDALPAMKDRAAERSFAFPYLFDESQQIAKDFGAKYTPQFFVFDGDRKLVYQGSMDDSPDGKAVTKTHVAEAVRHALGGEKPQVEETVPIGCRIRFHRERRRKTRD